MTRSALSVEHYFRRLNSSFFNYIYVYLIYNFIHVCVSVGVCVKAMRFDIPAPIATKLHTHTKDLPRKVFKPISISYTYLKDRFALPPFRLALSCRHGILLLCAAQWSSKNYTMGASSAACMHDWMFVVSQSVMLVERLFFRGAECVVVWRGCVVVYVCRIRTILQLSFALSVRSRIIRTQQKHSRIRPKSKQIALTHWE